MIPNFWLLLSCACALLAVLGMVAGLIKERFWFSEPLICAALGIVVVPVGLGLLRLDPGSDPLSAQALQEAAWVTLAIAVSSAAFRLPPGWLRKRWRCLAVALGPGMLATTAMSAPSMGAPETAICSGTHPDHGTTGVTADQLKTAPTFPFGIRGRRTAVGQAAARLSGWGRRVRAGIPSHLTRETLCPPGWQ